MKNLELNEEQFGFDCKSAGFKQKDIYDLYDFNFFRNLLKTIPPRERI